MGTLLILAGIIYALTVDHSIADAQLGAAIRVVLLSAHGSSTDPDMWRSNILFSVSYTQREGFTQGAAEKDGRVRRFQPADLDLVFDDTVLENVEAAWKDACSLVDESDREVSFMRFEDRSVGTADFGAEFNE
jgi:hypothetical protein